VWVRQLEKSLLPFLSLSLMCHVAGLAWWAEALQFYRPSHSPAPLTVERFVDSSPPKILARPRGRKGRASLSLSDLGISWHSKGGISIPSVIGGDAGAAPGIGGGSGTALAGIEMTVPMHRLAEGVENFLDYPKEFIDEGIEGEAEVAYVFEAGKPFHPRAAKVRCRSPYVRVFVLRLLEQVWSDPLPTNFFRRGPLPVRFHFRFEATGKDNPFYDSLAYRAPNVTGNSLYFVRKGPQIGTWKLGPIAGYGIAPAVAIDPGWFVDRAEELLGTKERPDPLRKYRRDPLF